MKESWTWIFDEFLKCMLRDRLSSPTLNLDEIQGSKKHACPILSNRYDPWMAWHDSYDPYRSWNNGLRVVQVAELSCRTDNGDLHIISKTALQPGQHDPYDSYDPYGSWNNGSRVVQLVNCIDIYTPILSNRYDPWMIETTRTTRTGREIIVYGSYRSRNYPVEQTMVTCISLVRQHFNQDSTTRTTRTTRTGRETMVHESYNWWTA